MGGSWSTCYGDILMIGGSGGELLCVREEEEGEVSHGVQCAV